MARPAALLTRALVLVHRWLGVVLSLLFLLWFLSGIVMVYRTFPSVSEEDRLARAPALDPSQVALSAADAFTRAGREEAPTRVRLETFDGRPVYRAADFGRPNTVFADDGTVPVVDEGAADRAAAAWADLPATQAQKTSVEEVDQWTVGSDVQSIRPLYKYTFPDGQQVYVDGGTADVVQYTTTASRTWAWLGAIPHWLYFTPLRKHGPEWFSFVVWSSSLGTVAVLLGLIVAIWMYSPKRRYRHAGVPTAIPYRGWKRLHTIAGLVFGLVTLTWTFSGLLSMGPFPLTDRLAAVFVPEAGRDVAAQQGLDPDALQEALRGRELDATAYSARHPSAAIASLGTFEVKQLELTSFDGAPVYLARNGQGETRIVPVHGDPAAGFDADAIMRLVRAAANGSLAELRLLDEYDAHYRDRHGRRPLPVVYARLDDAVGSRFYIDPGTAAVVESYDSRAWVSRWLYRGLHGLDFPWLYNRRPLWDVVVVGLMLGGSALCATSVVLAWRVLVRTLLPRSSAASRRSNEDLTV